MLITGAAGMLGRDLTEQLQSCSAELLLTDAAEPENRIPGLMLLDITDSSAVEAAAAAFSPDWIINCAAYTNVDRAETDYRAAFSVNAFGPANLAQEAARRHCSLLHISSDYVFGGSGAPEKKEALDEQARLDPCGVYGFSKAFGDRLIAAALPSQQTLILRTSWLHGRHGPNFIHTMLRLGKEKNEVRVVDDQIGSPTWTKWLAGVICELIARRASGIFNVSSRGGISWFRYAQEIFRQAGLGIQVTPISSADLNRPAPRPPFSTLDTSKLEGFLGKRCPQWQEDVSLHLREIGSLKEEQ